MYRPQKRKLVRRLSTVSAVALVAIAGAGITWISQGGAATPAPNVEKSAVDNAPTAATTASNAKYHLVSPPLEETSSSDAN